MRAELVPRLRCPACRIGGSLDLGATRSDEREIREGTLVCRACGATHAVRGGIADLFPPELPPFVLAESAGLDRFADTMRGDGWEREDILALPFRAEGYWYAQAVAMKQTLATRSLGLRRGKRLLDIGSNTCWASATFAARGLDVTSLDINAGEMQGLATADWWFVAKNVYFERVLGVMFELPFADSTFDYCWCCEVLHHNHRSNLYATMRELFRVLKPGGRLIVVNETVRSLRDPKLNPGHEVADYSGHEHAFIPWSYTHAARRAGFDVAITYPWTVPMFTQSTFPLKPSTPVWQAAWWTVVHAVRRVAPLRRIALFYKQYGGSAALHMIATKPARP